MSVGFTYDKYENWPKFQKSIQFNVLQERTLVKSEIGLPIVTKISLNLANYTMNICIARNQLALSTTSQKTDQNYSYNIASQNAAASIEGHIRYHKKTLFILKSDISERLDDNNVTAYIELVMNKYSKYLIATNEKYAEFVPISTHH